MNEPTLGRLTSLDDGRGPSPTELIDHLPMAVVVCDLAGRIVQRNATFDALFGGLPASPQPHLRDLFDERGRTRLPDVVAEAFASAEDDVEPEGLEGLDLAA